MNIKDFYTEQKNKEEFSFTQRTGLNIRHSFQTYKAGTGCDEIFSLQTSRRECLGIEFSKGVFYLLPVSQQSTVVMIYDDSLMPVIDVLSDWSEARCEVYCRHTSSLASAIENAYSGKYSNYCAFFDEEMLCFVKQICYPLIDKLNDGVLFDPDLIIEMISLVQYRNQCENEITSFSGFTSKEEKEIAVREGISAVKHGLNILRLSDRYSVDNK